MKYVNKIILLGRLGRDPILRETKNGRALASFSLATSRKFKGDDADGTLIEETQWHNVAAFGRQAENCKKYLRKGHMVYVEGTLRSHTYEAKDGSHRTSFDVYVDEISFIGIPANSNRVETSGGEDLPVAQAS
jgi:single-strand DNA-binding protein